MPRALRAFARWLSARDRGWARREVDYAGSQAVEEQANGVGFAALFSALYH
jgi:hypothetical protein